MPNIHHSPSIDSTRRYSESPDKSHISAKLAVAAELGNFNIRPGQVTLETSGSYSTAQVAIFSAKFPANSKISAHLTAGSSLSTIVVRCHLFFGRSH
jgi:hypothetical protein